MQVLNIRYDPLVDYGASEELESDVAPGESVRLNCTFFDKRWSTGRTVTCMDWSVKHPELIAVGYNDNPDAIHDPDGVVMVWNTHMTTRPEYVFECQVRRGGGERIDRRTRALGVCQREKQRA